MADKLMEELRKSLKKQGLDKIADIVLNAKNQTLNDLMEYTLDDLVQTLRDINDDPTNKHKIKTSHRYKFAKTVDKFSVSYKEIQEEKTKEDRDASLKSSKGIQFLFIGKEEEEAM
eukprot:793275_1